MQQRESPPKYNPTLRQPYNDQVKENQPPSQKLAIVSTQNQATGAPLYNRNATDKPYVHTPPVPIVSSIAKRDPPGMLAGSQPKRQPPNSLLSKSLGGLSFNSEHVGGAANGGVATSLNLSTSTLPINNNVNKR